MRLVARDVSLGGGLVRETTSVALQGIPVLVGPELFHIGHESIPSTRVDELELGVEPSGGLAIFDAMAQIVLIDSVVLRTAAGRNGGEGLSRGLGPNSVPWGGSTPISSSSRRAERRTASLGIGDHDGDSTSFRRAESVSGLRRTGSQWLRPWRADR